MGSIYKNRMRYTGEASSGDSVFVKYKTEENEVVLNTAIQNLIDGLESTKAVIYLDEQPETITDNFYVIDGKVYMGNETAQKLERIYTAEEIDDTFIKLEEKGEADGVAPLDENGFIPVEYLPTSTLIYLGMYDASTGTVPEAPERAGSFYIISVAGTIEGVDYNAGDWIIWNGTKWEKSDNTNEVISVDGMKGEVDLEDKYAQLNAENTFTEINKFEKDIVAERVTGSSEDCQAITFTGGKVRVDGLQPVLSINGDIPDDNGNIEVGFKVWTGTLAQYQAMTVHDPSTMYLIKG
jgi:hypothetical protein